MDQLLSYVEKMTHLWSLLKTATHELKFENLIKFQLLLLKIKHYVKRPFALKCSYVIH